MEVILLENIKKLGKIGEVVTVKPGFGRNFLVPNGKAIRASKANIEEFKAKQAEFEKENAAKKEAAEKLANSIKDVKIVLLSQAGEDGRLFGSVATKDIVQGLKEKGFIVDKLSVKIKNPIKYLGIHVIEVQLHSEISVNIYLNVARNKDEATSSMREYLMDAEDASKNKEEKAS